MDDVTWGCSGVGFAVLEVEVEGFGSGLAGDLGGDSKECGGREVACT